MKRTFKKAMSILLALTLLFGSFAFGFSDVNFADFAVKAEAATSGTCGENLTYSLDTSSGELTISGTGDMYNWSRSAYAPWYSNRSDIKSVTIGNNVTSIGDYAFEDCTGLTSVTIPNSVTSIGDYAFYYCQSLTSVTIPDSVTSIGAYAFKSCYFLTSVTIGNNVTSIGDYAFYYCQSLTSVTIPDSVTSIGAYAFADCISLTTVIIPDSVISLGGCAFAWCTSITSITVNSNNKHYSSDKYGVLFNKDKTELIQYPAGNARTSYKILNSVTSIGAYAFTNCYSLTSVTIPDSVTSIGYSAFKYCYSLTSITVDSANPSYSSDEYGVLFNKNKTELIQYPAGNTRTSYAIPDSVTSIGEDAFAICDSLTSVTIPDSVISIGYYAFRECNNLTSATIPDSVTSIGEGAFKYCDSLTSITIPDSVTSIGESAFDYCRSLTSITIPNSVTSIGEGAFYYCDSLTDVYYNGTEDQWNKISIGSYNECLTNATIHFNFVSENEPTTKPVVGPDSVYNGFVYAVDEKLEVTINDFIGQIDGALEIPDTINGYPVTSIGRLAFSYMDIDEVIFNCTQLETIGDGAFTGCANLTEVSIPDTVTSIGSSAFSYNDNLTTVNIPESVEYVGDSCFEYNSNLQYVNWESATLTKIEESTFEGCDLLEEITIPSSVEYIDDYGFAYCGNLVSVCINDAILEIGDYAFKDCVKIEGTEILYGEIGPGISVPNAISEYEMILPYGLEYIGNGAFENCKNIKKLTIPETVTAIGESAFKNCTSIQSVKYSGTSIQWNAIDIHSGNNALYEEKIIFTDKIINKPSTTVIDYGETLYLHINSDGLPTGAKIVWNSDSDAVLLIPSSDGKSCGVKSVNTGDAIITVSVVNQDNTPVTDGNGDDIISTQKITSKAGIWQKIISFFKNLFGMNRIIEQVIKF